MSTVEAPRTGVRVHVQKLGTSLSNMVMPNIGAFIAWGLITALFIEQGWLQAIFSGLRDPDGWVARIGGWGSYDGAGIVGPMITYLLPVLIGYTGGRMIHGNRGAVVGAIATMGVVAGADVPMFMGAMIMGPLGGWAMKKADALWEGRVRPGFEMLVDNFSAGILGMLLAILGFFGVGPIVSSFTRAAGNAVDFLVGNDLLPLTSLLIEPAKVLFLNNAINHGVLTPLGTTQALDTGKSILFLLETNPGPGLGVLLAFMVFGRGAARASAPGAAIIQFFGGIHEIYFPYVLMKPKLIAATILGGMTGVFINVLFGSGLRAPAAPGSIIAIYAQTASGSFLGVTLAVLGATAVSFAVASLLLKTDRAAEVPDLAAATAEMEALKGKKSSVASTLVGAQRQPVTSIVFACDAGMGSSAMGASVLRKKIRSAGFGDITVTNQSIANLTDTYDMVVTHRDLTDRARLKTGSAVHISVDDFMSSPRYDEIVETLRDTNSAAGEIAEVRPESTANDVLPLDSIVLAGTATSAAGAIDEAGALLVAADAVEPAYVDAMHEREKSVSTYMGNGLAIPHGTNEAKSTIRRTGISFVRYPEPIDWNGKPAEFVVGIAGQGNDHMALLTKIAHVFLDKDEVARLRAATSADEVRSVLSASE
ncbi:PTS mannose transporter subunit IIA [Mycolicibacterium conceptionense]|uniref:Mannitol-specific phosphotransferase enzyme IIA component n=1 Tax=Mycolicibacterium conceptionense TaxID=451644 RepID=A0A0U1D1C8_9MYCO|nr:MULTISPECIES: PTS mannitol transporter subunit IICBA [Mycolicibacterium]MCW1819982.1 PTS mannitol transporter subunit IICBA [Mycolicibacterium senegalense]OBB06637.1 PTS mannose transporter subunit IIA [Mycolicibacterium conceptionense]OBF04571.1 PTS mannose transporter subunit IIA [Mycolicibacterium conceptionense]OBF16994.1 PTS mannose transporter subunit IIA [Mycolicibacterium conceptionense]OBF42984.1 PTS mannose transporter subunit IIA [Mycolicibacterium conceptionense]